MSGQSSSPQRRRLPDGHAVVSTTPADATAEQPEHAPEPSPVKPELTCSIDGCDGPRYQGRVYCGSHFMRAYRYGDPLHVPEPRGPVVDLSGALVGRLTVQSYDRERRRWLCVCECGAPCHRTTNQLNQASDHTCGDRRRHRRTDTAGYGAAHDRVRRDRGLARRHRRAACRRNQARQWAYDHSDPDERIDAQCGPYSLDPARYRPLCIGCHKRADLERCDRSNGQAELW